MCGKFLSGNLTGEANVIYTTPRGFFGTLVNLLRTNKNDLFSIIEDKEEQYTQYSLNDLMKKAG